jgi:hypothetical protein
MAEIQAVLPRRLGPLMRNADGIWRLDPRRLYAGRVRSAEELRARWLDLIALIMKRTGMYAATGSEMQLLALHLLKDLCFLDDRDADAEREWSRLLRTYGKRGAVGPFEALFESRRCQAEVASVFAEVFHRLGYLSVGKLVSGDRWQEMTSGLRDRFEDRDVTQDGARGLLGEPSLVIDRKVLCYVPEDPAAGWLFIDCHAEQARRYNVGRGSYTADRDAEPLIRSVRLSGQDFESGLILTLYGKTLRWGPGWWLDHPGQNQSADEAAIAAQLRAIRAADPSQSLRRPGS